MKILKDESGQAMILTLVCMTCLLGFVGFAADIGTLLNAKRQMQTAADNAAIAAVLEQNYGDMTTAADAAAAQNGVTVGVSGGAVAVNSPPLAGAYVGQAGYVEAIVSQSEPTFFMKMFNFASQTVSARAVATTGIGTGCIVTLGTSGTDISVTSSSSSPTLNAPGCGISANSTSGTALSVVSSGAAHPIIASSIGIAGNYSEVGGTVSPTPVTGIAPLGDPLAYLPTPTAGGSCMANPNVVKSGGTVTIPAGNYCSGISVVASGATINFSSGTYTIGGSGLSIIGSGDTFNGSGVTFYVSSGSISDTASGSTYNLTAPTSGTYSGILFDQSSSDTSGASITESGTGSTFEGVIYLPDASLTFTASGTTANLYMAFVTKSLTITTSGSSINDYAALNGTSPIKAARLVE